MSSVALLTLKEFIQKEANYIQLLSDILLRNYQLRSDFLSGFFDSFGKIPELIPN